MSTKELRIKAVTPSIDDEIKDLQKSLERINKRMQKQIEAYEMDLIGADDLKAARERIEAERREIERKIRELESKSNDSSAVQKKAVEFLPTINGIDRLAAKNAIRGLIEEIQVRDGKLVEITWKA